MGLVPMSVGEHWRRKSATMDLQELGRSRLRVVILLYDSFILRTKRWNHPMESGDARVGLSSRRMSKPLSRIILDDKQMPWPLLSLIQASRRFSISGLAGLE